MSACVKFSNAGRVVGTTARLPNWPGTQNEKPLFVGAGDLRAEQEGHGRDRATNSPNI
jgi:hypothetical protein